MADNRENAGLDQALLERLYVRLEKPMFNVVYRWVWNPDEAEDIVQDAFVRVWRARERVDVTTVEALLYRTALNLASNHRRARRVRGWLGLDDVEEVASRRPSTEQALDAEQTRARVRAAVEALPEKLRRVVVLSEYAELSYAEISAILGVPTGTVGSRRNTALRQLGEALGGLEESTS
jgi:RNA polymerase sigma-70 factor (ECF subfamily)